MPDVVAKLLLVLFYALCFGFLFLNLIGLPGNWILVVTALVLVLTGKFAGLTWTIFFVVMGIAVVGEIIEALLGIVIVSKQGGTRWGVIGSFVGGLVGVVTGSSVIPPVGSVIFGFAGAFAGAVIGEYMREARKEEALRVGWWSFIGRMMAMMGKVVAGAGIVWVLITRTW